MRCAAAAVSHVASWRSMTSPASTSRDSAKACDPNQRLATREHPSKRRSDWHHACSLTMAERGSLRMRASAGYGCATPVSIDVNVRDVSVNVAANSECMAAVSRWLEIFRRWDQHVRRWW
ncbi:hypothetical protein F1559_005166 [Cyanidiococcus yangmingshanensis]|uniref:Uncharacterized protein n=1 Tax=Cyanidiococcus yangmingshanensis TaxID=2690220 RepID=A0A7J7IFW6_9RHOD|nr:hypothetical protein F1559_005166 [Cyanidiococcus yangmingshanensis]